MRFSLSKCLLRLQETWAKVSLGAKRSKKPVSYLLYNFSNNSKMLTVSLARIGQIFPAIFSEKYIFLVFIIFLYILKIRKIYFSEKIAGKFDRSWPMTLLAFLSCLRSCTIDKTQVCCFFLPLRVLLLKFIVVEASIH